MTAQMGKVGLKPGSTSSTELFPLRPAFGSTGKPVSLWTNYFRVNAKPTALYKYNLEFAQVATETTDDSGNTVSAKIGRAHV